ncbi:MAG: Gfo/Idh/MocA family oxidoreductase [Clostridia bacterium]|nr:Gfo/Idh/MocA family oxidoreductase [Clostridia bacterium]
MKAALIGNGFIGSEHRKAYAMLRELGSDVELVAICDIRAERRENAVNNGARCYASVDELLANERDLDYVDICLPTYLHAEYANKCMKAGLNVLCEKPMALTVADAQSMINTSKKTGKRLMIAHSARFLNQHQAIRNFIKEGSLGKPTSAFFIAADGFPRHGWNNWFSDNSLSGGSMLDLQAHHIDLVNGWFGVPASTSTVAKERGDFKGYSSVSANLLYEDDLFVHIWTDWSVSKNRFNNRTIRVNFENGYIYLLSREPDGIVCMDNQGNQSVVEHSKMFKAGMPSYFNEIEYYTNCLKSGEPFELCPPEESIRVVAVMRAEEQSANAQGAPVGIL